MIKIKKRWWFDYYSAGAYSKIGAVKDSIIYVKNIGSVSDVSDLIKATRHTSNILLIPYKYYAMTKYRSKTLWAVVSDISYSDLIRVCSAANARCVYEQPDNEYYPEFQYNIFKWIVVGDGNSLLIKYLMYGIPIWDKSRTVINRYPEEIWKIKKRRLLKK